MPMLSPAVAGPDLPCLVLAGGKSVRFGAAKGRAALAGISLVDRVRDVLAGQTSGPIALNAPRDGAYAAQGLALVLDAPEWAGVGPLAGVLAGMRWAAGLGAKRLVTAPLDAPFLPPDYVARLSAAPGPAFARSLGRDHPVCGAWRTDDADTLEAALRAGLRAAGAWAERCGAVGVDFPAPDGDPFFNINTPADLAEAEARLARARPSL